MSQPPSDSPGIFAHTYASISGTPVFVVGRTPTPRPGGLHQLPLRSVLTTPSGWLYGAAAYADMSLGPRPLRLVSTTNPVVGTAVPRLSAYHWSVRPQVLKSLGLAG